MSEENSADETIGATTTIILKPARISSSTVEPSRREITRKLRKERRLSWALVLGMLVFARRQILQKGGSMTITGLQGLVKDLFEMTRLDLLFEIQQG